MGMTQINRFVSVEIPIAFPMIFTGIRIATVTTIAAAIFATSVGDRGLASVIYKGIRTQNMKLILFGTIALMIMAVFFDLLMAWINKGLEKGL